MPEKERSFAAVHAPDREDSAIAEPSIRRHRFDLPEGALGILFLLVLSAFCGALIAVYWPFAQGSGEAATGDRLSTLEAKVDAIAAGHASKAAAEVFVGQRRDMAALKSRLDADEARLATIEKSQSTADASDLDTLMAGVSRNSANIKQMSERLARLEQGDGESLTSDRAKTVRDRLSNFEKRVAFLEKSAPPAGLAQKLDSFALKSEEGALETRILQLETQDMGGVMRRAAAVMALADLVRASSGSEPFAGELAALKNLAPASAELQDLARYAGKGVPTKTMLSESFARQADTILATEHATAGNSWSDRIWSGVVGAVSPRRIGIIVGKDSEARVARAEVDLNVGELARAIHEVSAMSGPAREAATPWLKAANERINVDRDARVLAEHLVADLSAQPAANQPPAAAPPGK